MPETLTPAQRRTLPARQALEAKFATTVEKTEYFRDLALRSHERRLTLSGDEAAAVLRAQEQFATFLASDGARYLSCASFDVTAGSGAIYTA